MRHGHRRVRKQAVPERRHVLRLQVHCLHRPELLSLQVSGQRVWKQLLGHSDANVSSNRGAIYFTDGQPDRHAVHKPNRGAKYEPNCQPNCIAKHKPECVADREPVHVADDGTDRVAEHEPDREPNRSTNEQPDERADRARLRRQEHRR